MESPSPKRFSPTLPLSVAAIVVLMGAIFFTISNVQQQQNDQSKASSANLLSNPGCEGSTSLFKGYQATLSTTTASPHSGSSSCKVVSTGGSFYDIETLQSAPSPQVGQSYTGIAYVRSDSNVGNKVYVALRESGGSSPTKTTYGPAVTLTSSWQMVTNTVTIQSSGRTSLDYYIVQDPGSSGQSFYVDDMVFQSGAVSSTSTTQATNTTAGTTFGTTNAGNITDTGDNNNLTCNRYTATATGTVNALSAFVGSTNSGDKTYSMGIYADSGGNPSSLLGKTTDGQLTANSWNTLPVSASVTSGAAYWLCYNSRATSNSYNNVKYTSGSTPAVYRDQSYGTWPNPFGTVQSRWTDTYSLYATVGTTITLAPTAAPTATPFPPTLTPTRAPTGIPTAVPTPTHAPTPTQPIATPTTAPTIALVTATPFPTGLPTPTPTSVQPTSLPTATPTPAPGSTLVTANLLLHGIGHGGDSVNPNGLGTTNPLHAQRTITMDIYNAQNQLVTSQQGTVAFDSTAGNFSGAVNLGTGFASGVYTIKIKSDQYLRGLVSGIQTITAGQNNVMPSLTLIAGDVNGDNQINIVDYNMIVGCYSDLLPPVSCPGNNAAMTDLTDDGAVNQFDYNFFIRELTNLGGQ